MRELSIAKTKTRVRLFPPTKSNWRANIHLESVRARTVGFSAICSLKRACRRTPKRRRVLKLRRRSQNGTTSLLPSTYRQMVSGKNNHVRKRSSGNRQEETLLVVGPVNAGARFQKLPPAQASTSKSFCWMAALPDLAKGRGSGWAIPLLSIVRQRTVYSPAGRPGNKVAQ